MYLISIRYEDDPERKRIEYTLDKWKKDVSISKLDGIVVVVETNDIESLVEELYSRSARGDLDKIKVYRLEETSPDIGQQTRHIKIRSEVDKNAILEHVKFIMARQVKAVLKDERDGPLRLLYEARTRKGRAEIRVMLENDGKVTDLDLDISGYGEVVDFVYNKLYEQLEHLEVKN